MDVSVALDSQTSESQSYRFGTPSGTDTGPVSVARSPLTRVRGSGSGMDRANAREGAGPQAYARGSAWLVARVRESSKLSLERQ